MDEKAMKKLAEELASGIKTAEDYSNFSATLHKMTLEAALGAEMEHHLGYTKNARSDNHKFDKACVKANIEHRLAKSVSPQTNGMVERVNGTIKNATIKAQTYASFDEMLMDLDKFLLFYNFNRESWWT